MGVAKNDNLKGQGFHTHPERINKKGAPKLPDLKELMEEIMGDNQKGKTHAFVILKALRTKAAKGDHRCAEILLNRGYGIPKQSIDLNSTGETIIRVIRDKEL